MTETNSEIDNDIWWSFILLASNDVIHTAAKLASKY
jgi:hypothetical protein